MKKLFKYLLITMTTLVLVACGSGSSEPLASNKQQTSTTLNSQNDTQFNASDFDTDDLKGTKIFIDSAIEHIFFGTINREGKATGYHYEGLAPDVEVIEKTRSKTDKNGVYRAKITIDGEPKKAYSTFFPQDWTPQEVVDAINEAYDERDHVSGNIYEGESQGLTIQMYLTDNNKIISAFPIYER